MKAILSLLMFLPCLVNATQILWYCPPERLNLTEDGVEMGGSFRFELGAFKDGFVPTTNNLNEWSEHWIPAQRTVYNEEHDWFTNRLTVTEDSPISRGSAAYIWGFSGDPANGEWMLFRNAGWTWPGPSPRNPVLKMWSTSAVNVVIIGGVSEGYATLRSATVTNVPPPETQWDQWALEHLGNASADPREDANGNGMEDGLEFVLGIDGASNFSVAGLEIRIVKDEAGENVVELVVPRRSDRPARIGVEISADLDTWYGAGDLVNLHANRPLELVFRGTSDMVDVGGQWFWRYTAEPEE